MNSLNKALKSIGYSDEHVKAIDNTNYPNGQYVEFESINSQVDENIIISSSSLKINEFNSSSTNYIVVDRLVE